MLITRTKENVAVPEPEIICMKDRSRKKVKIACEDEKYINNSSVVRGAAFFRENENYWSPQTIVTGILGVR